MGRQKWLVKLMQKVNNKPHAYVGVFTSLRCELRRKSLQASFPFALLAFAGKIRFPFEPFDGLNSHLHLRVLV